MPREVNLFVNECYFKMKLSSCDLKGSKSKLRLYRWEIVGGILVNFLRSSRSLDVDSSWVTEQWCPPSIEEPRGLEIQESTVYYPSLLSTEDLLEEIYDPTDFILSLFVG